MATPTSLPASFVDTTSLPAASLNNLRGAFRVLQVLSAQTTLQIINNTSTFVDIGLSVTITPQSTTNKILLINAQAIYTFTNAAEAGVRFLRGATNIFTVRPAMLATGTGGSFSSIFLDSPNTTSATTYKVQGARDAGTGDLRFQVNSVTASTLIVCEISA
jgi:hypothetical protein